MVVPEVPGVPHTHGALQRGTTNSHGGIHMGLLLAMGNAG